MGEQGHVALQQNRPITQAVSIPMGHSICRGFATEMSFVKIFLEELLVRDMARFRYAIVTVRL